MNVDIDVLHLGGPKLCQDSFPSNFTFDDNSSPRINVTLCGVPQPVVRGDFIGETLNVQNTTVNDFTHNYTLHLPLLTQLACGKNLTVTANNSIGGILTETTQIFVRNCKYDNCFC